MVGNDKIIEKVSNNIRTLAKIKGLKIGDIERSNGLTTGYLSRNKDIRLSALTGIANQLGVTIDELLNNDYNDMLIDCKIRDLEIKRNELSKEIEGLERQKKGVK